MAKPAKLQDSPQAQELEHAKTNMKANLKLASSGDGSETIEVGEHSKEVDVKDVISGVPKFQEFFGQQKGLSEFEAQEISLDQLVEFFASENLPVELEGLKKFFQENNFENSDDFFKSLSDLQDEVSEQNEQSNNSQEQASSQENAGGSSFSSQNTEQSESQEGAEAEGEQVESLVRNRAPERGVPEGKARQEFKEDFLDSDRRRAPSEEEKELQEKIQDEVGEIENPFTPPEYKDPTHEGSKGNDKVVGSSGDDVIYGGKGDDVLHGGKGNDTFQIDSGSGKDQFYGGSGEDSIEALNGADVVIDKNFGRGNSIEKIVGDGDSEV
ncbi:MAG: hypothetical protein ACPGJV_16455, partial [Bacteriovoracaceae bacterium]